MLKLTLKTIVVLFYFTIVFSVLGYMFAYKDDLFICGIIYLTASFVFPILMDAIDDSNL